MIWLIVIIAVIAFFAAVGSVTDSEETSVQAEPSDQTDDLYGMSEAEIVRRLRSCTAQVKGLHGGGLHDTGFGAMRENAGRRGEYSLAAALIRHGLLDDPNTCVWFSLRNPGDDTGNTDIDCVIARGTNVWLLDAKHYYPAAKDLYLESAGDRAVKGGDRTYVTSRNMAWVTNAVRERLGFARIHPLVLLCRTRGGVYGIRSDVRWPGDIPVRQTDQWLSGMAQGSDCMPSSATIRLFDSLVKTPEIGSAKRACFGRMA
ncbi:nuclease-related domain-containing protein [Bifidobacterium simiarum]|uniref:nuclease-related domain-containing protein n=1 Tax=Bifidobacterium simiarum TaxID=2045441 RepID=UPI001BDC064E|nr:nuclease-related domain-containing protein [Bifidobacterium simiarum]MBT1166288.1 NERD domain-containing protein [Bifidobacterium simiarum]